MMPKRWKENFIQKGRKKEKKVRSNWRVSWKENFV
jgi:hypothetical protein